VTKLLYVEDNDDNVFMLKMRLELLGDFEVLTAEDGDSKCPSWTPNRSNSLGWSQPFGAFSPTANDAQVGTCTIENRTRLRLGTSRYRDRCQPDRFR